MEIVVPTEHALGSEVLSLMEQKVEELLALARQHRVGLLVAYTKARNITDDGDDGIGTSGSMFAAAVNVPYMDNDTALSAGVCRYLSDSEDSGEDIQVQLNAAAESAYNNSGRMCQDILKGNIVFNTETNRYSLKAQE